MSVILVVVLVILVALVFDPRYLASSGVLFGMINNFLSDPKGNGIKPETVRPKEGEK